MRCLDLALEYESVQSESEVYPVVIVAAGSASRMKGIDKIMTKLCGMPVIVRTVTAFYKCERISEIVLVTREEKISEFSDLFERYGLAENIILTKGGDCREESVLNGLRALGSSCEKVLVHDGARPLITQEVILRVCDALDSNDSVTCGVKMKDTVKVVNEDAKVIKTLQRDFLVSIQTPQGISVNKFYESAEKNDLFRFTDDTSVVEAVGASTVVVDGDYKNIKITTPEDMKLAEVYLSTD